MPSCSVSTVRDDRGGIVNNVEPDSDAVVPTWFRTWRENDEKSRSRRELTEGGFSIFTIGLGGVAVALGLAALKDTLPRGFSEFTT